MRQGSGDYDDLADFLNVILSRAWFNLRDSKNFHKFIHKKLSHVIRRTKVKDKRSSCCEADNYAMLSTFYFKGSQVFSTCECYGVKAQ
jgi:hypothetical protein